MSCPRLILQAKSRAPNSSGWSLRQKRSRSRSARTRTDWLLLCSTTTAYQSFDQVQQKVCHCIRTAYHSGQSELLNSTWRFASFALVLVSVRGLTQEHCHQIAGDVPRSSDPGTERRAAIPNWLLPKSFAALAGPSSTTLLDVRLLL